MAGKAHKVMLGINQSLRQKIKSFCALAGLALFACRVHRKFDRANVFDVEAFQRKNNMLKLHVGCGSKKLPGYVNIDKFDKKAADLLTSADNLPFPENSVDEIFSSHMIEHLSPMEFENALHEWHRVLKSGSNLKVRCPNFEVYVREWLEGDYDSRWGWGIINIFGHDRRGPGLLTRNGFTRERLERLLSEFGFAARRCQVVPTRAEFDGTVEYRPDGDLDYEGFKVEKPRVLYIDALSEPEAQTNINGICRAYRKVGVLKTFDYRSLAKEHGQLAMNRLLVETAFRFQPDLVHLGKSETVYGHAIKWIKKKTNAKVVHFYGDFRPDAQPWVVDIGRFADKTLLYHKDSNLIQKHKRRGIEHIGHWWVGTDPEIFCRRKVPKKYDVVFMANNTSDIEEIADQGYRGRKEFVEAVADSGIDLHLFGKGWESLKGRDNVHLHSFVNDEEFAEACSAAKIALGYCTDQVYFYTSWRRPLNTMACGTFFLTRYFPGLEEVFDNKKHLGWFDTTEEAVAMIKYYLSSQGERERIAERGRQEVLARHTWDVRIADMIKYVED